MSVRVVARIRPLLDKELDKDTIVRAEASHEGKPFNIVRIPNPKNELEEFSFTFNGVYDMETTQEELFTNEVAPNLKSLFQGLDVTIFAYGVTGTGKTHTMRGGLKLSERGVIPRLLSGIYRRGRKVVKDSGGETEVYVTLSYYEIYNDKVYDLFESPDKRTPAGLPLREKDGKTMVVGLSERACDDLKDFEKLYIEANNNRSTAGTKLNAQSSRSHAILMVKLTQVYGEETLVSTASAIDLAGSEDNRRTDNGKERLVESASINKSLFVLSQCIDAIGRGDKRIPYRESKMTRILSLGQNNGITIMILNLAPLRSYHLDTLSSLNVSSRAKRIEVREIENEVVFKQPPRTTSGLSGTNMLRQPLRPLANAHNIVHAGATKSGDKPTKAFSVYSDKTTLGSRASNTGLIARHSASKRPSDSTISGRSTKIIRQNPSTRGAEISAAKIEEMVERKVAEILASKAMNQPTPAPSNEISEAVQRRLEALEKKVESGAQEDTEGLRFLLMAKQHKERGEDSSALKMYELAVPFFPHHEKLHRKIEILREKIRMKKEEAAMRDTARQTTVLQLPTSALSLEAPMKIHGLVSKPKKTQAKANSGYELTGSLEQKQSQANSESDDEYVEATIAEDHYSEHDNEDDSFVSNTPKPKSRKSRATKASSISTSLPSSSFLAAKADAPPTPCSTRLLDIINSRQESQIKGLRGVGAKKARDLVEFLELMSDEERIESLRQLVRVPGLGSKTVEKMYEGIAA